MLTTLAWKNIWRNKIRSLVVIAAIVVGLTGGIFSIAVMNGMVERRMKAAVELETSHIQIHNPAFIENKEIQYRIFDSDSLSHVLSSNPAIRSFSFRTKVFAMINSPYASNGVMINGIDPEIEKKVTGIYQKIDDSSGNYFSTDKRNQIVISKRLADKLKVKLRSKITLTFQGIGDTLTGGSFKIVGIYNTSNGPFDEMNVFVRNSDLKRIANIGAVESHEVAIMLKEPEQYQLVADELKKNLPGYNIQTWKEIQPELGMMNDMMAQMYAVLMVIIMLALMFGIVNTMLMSVLERVRELGMLMAIGMNKRRIFRMIMLETLFLSLTGAVIGMIVSFLIILQVQKTGINLAVFAEGLESFGYESMIYPSLGVLYYVMFTLMIAFFAIISSIYPARKALSLNPADALKTF
jgi:ABC-type lipoprotein release transport system permease subunit